METKFDPKSVLLPFELEKEYLASKVNDGIEANRKKNMMFCVVDKDRNPVKDVKIHLTQKNHEFLHGANCFMLDELETPEKNEAYKKNFAEVFNLATVPFYWNGLEPEDGKPRFDKNSPKVYRRPAPDICLEYCEEKGITPKLHCLNYDLFRPEWLAEKYPTQAEQKARLLRRFREIAERYADRIHGIEVTNETLCWSGLNPFDPKRDLRYESFLSDPEIVEWSFKMAEQLFPANELIINEANVGFFDHCSKLTYNSYYQQIEKLLAKGTRIDSVGLQYHFWADKTDAAEKGKAFYDPYRMYQCLDTFARLGKPIQITEITFPCFGADEESQAVQAEVLRNMYSIWFSHPAVEAAIYWNLVDGYAWGAEQGDMTKGENRLYGGLMNFDLTPKPAFHVLKELFGKTWRTDATLTTNEYGFGFSKVFCGEYDVEIVAGDKTVKKTVRIEKNAPEDAMRFII